MNVDYTVASTLAGDVNAGIKDVIITYDISCQWGKNFSCRLSDSISMPSLDIRSLNSFRFTVPKFHIIGHGALCQANFNLTYMDSVGMTHGESVETIWSHSSSLATWSRENGPAARHLILDTLGARAYGNGCLHAGNVGKHGRRARHHSRRPPRPITTTRTTPPARHRTVHVLAIPFVSFVSLSMYYTRSL